MKLKKRNLLQRMMNNRRDSHRFYTPNKLSMVQTAKSHIQECDIDYFCACIGVTKL